MREKHSESSRRRKGKKVLETTTPEKTTKEHER